MKFPAIALPTLEAIYELGQRVCAKIEQFQPDIVLGLAHSGWMPVVVSQTLWEFSRTSAFPPALRSNIGLEKHALYSLRFGKNLPAFCCRECSQDDRLGHYLAWLTEQHAWLGELQTQIQAVRPGIPQRILVVDDLFGGYRTSYTALGLIETLYPQAAALVIAGKKDLTNDLLDAWLQEFAPALAVEISQSRENRNSRTRYPHAWHERLKPLVTGSEDITPDSLNWQRLSTASAAVRAIQEVVPTAPALQAPFWAAELACAYAIQRLRGEIRDEDAASIPPDEAHFFPIYELTLTPIERLNREAWLRNGVTRKDVTRIYGSSPEKQAEGLQAVSLKYDWSRHGRGRGAVYFPDAASNSWIYAYNQSNDLMETPARPLSGFAEFAPHLWAGAYPVTWIDNQNDYLLVDLLNHGIQKVIDLTHIGEMGSYLNYSEDLRRASEKMGRMVTILHFSLPFRSAPAVSQMLPLLGQIQAFMTAGQGIYLHAGHNLEGRVPLTLACLLVRQGQTPQQALAQVNDFWLTSQPFLIHLPLTPAQQRFILRFTK